MSLTPWVIDVEPDAAVPGLFKIPFIASALKYLIKKNNYLHCNTNQNLKN